MSIGWEVAIIAMADSKHSCSLTAFRKPLKAPSWMIEAVTLPVWPASMSSILLLTGRIPRFWPLEGSADMGITSRISGENYLAGLIHSLAIVNYFKEEWMTEPT